MITTATSTLEAPEIALPSYQEQSSGNAAPYAVEPGRTHPLGATPDAGGVNFALFSEFATEVELLIFDEHDCPEPVQVIRLSPETNKTFHIWHVYVRGLSHGAHYAYRVNGPQNIHEGHRFDAEKVLVDPYARGNNKTLWRRGEACQSGSNLATSMRSVVIDNANYDWQGDEPLGTPMSELIIYETHVGGFTKSKTAKVKNPGSFKGIIEEDSVSQGAWRHGNRTAAGVRVRRQRSPAHGRRPAAAELLGL
jgi:glycogen operon protein